MRIALYHPRAAVGDGGITRSVRNLTREFAALGDSPRVIFEESGVRAPISDGEWIGIPHVGARGMRVPTKAGSALRDVDVVVLHSAWTLHNYAFARSAMSEGIPFVLAPRGAYDPQIVNRRRYLKRAWYVTFEKQLIAEAAAVHAFFDSQVSHAAALGFKGPSIVAPNGVAVPEPGSWDGGSSGQVVFVGRFDPEHKGLDLLIDAMAILDPSERPSLTMCGPDWKGGRAKLIEQITRRGLADWVEIQGPVYGQAKWQIMRSAQAFVYPSRWEAFGNSAAEAAATGVPTLVTPYPLGNYLSERGAAVSAEPNPTSIAEGLLRVTGADAPQIGKRATDVTKDFEWNSVARLWVEQLRRVTAAGVR